MNSLKELTLFGLDLIDQKQSNIEKYHRLQYINIKDLVLKIENRRGKNYVSVSEIIKILKFLANYNGPVALVKKYKQGFILYTAHKLVPTQFIHSVLLHFLKVNTQPYDGSTLDKTTCPFCIKIVF